MRRVQERRMPKREVPRNEPGCDVRKKPDWDRKIQTQMEDPGDRVVVVVVVVS